MPQPVFKMYGLPQAVRALEELPRRLQNKHTRIALNAAGGVLKKTAVANVPKQSGLLGRSMGVKVKVPAASFNPKHRSKPAYAVIGPRRGFLAPVAKINGKVKKLSIRAATKRVVSGAGKVFARNPARYAHLVHNPHNVVRGGKIVGRTKGHPFLTVAVRTSGQQALAKAEQKLRDGLEIERRALVNRVPVGVG